MKAAQLERLQEQLAKLRLIKSQERLEALLQEAVDKELSYADFLDQLLGPRVVGVDDAAELAAILGKQFVEYLRQQHGVVVVAGKDNGFARKLAGVVPYPFFHQIADEGAVGIAVENLFVDLVVFLVEVPRIFTILFELAFLLHRQVFVLDSLPQEPGGVGVDFVGD